MNKTLEQLKQEYKSTLNRMQDLGEILAHCAEMDTNHCGQDADEHQPAGYTYKDLLGMWVVCYGGKAMKCEGCPANHYGDTCVKVELTGGDYLCLAKPEQDFTDGKERPTISFDEEEGNVMDDIKEKTEAFLDYLDSIFNTKEQ